MSTPSRDVPDMRPRTRYLFSMPILPFEVSKLQQTHRLLKDRLKDPGIKHGNRCRAAANVLKTNGKPHICGPKIPGITLLPGMPKKLFFFLIPALLVLTALESRGQAAPSPFSGFGLGEFNGSALVNNQGMAGSGVSLPQVWYLNNINPAMLVYNRLTSFHAGMIFDQRRLKTSTQSEKTTGGNVSYLTLGFPALTKKDNSAVLWGTAIGLMPYTSVNYKIESTGTIAGSQEIDYFLEEKAQGGFNSIYWSNGVRITRSLSAGLKASYLFSSVISNYSNLLNQPAQLYRYEITLNEIVTVRGGRLSPSFHYRLDSIKGKYFLNIGGTYEFGDKLNSDFFQKFERKNVQGVVLQTDSLQSKTATLTFPTILTAGLSFGNADRWAVSADYTLTKFDGNTNRIGADSYPVTDGSRLAIGAEITPDSRSLTSLLKRITYRTGVSMEKSPYLVGGKTLEDLGINFGLSLPVSRISNLDFAVRFGKRGEINTNGLTENYFKVYFGVTYNDQWFIKSRFD